jgi:TPR repeat protein
LSCDGLNVKEDAMPKIAQTSLTIFWLAFSMPALGDVTRCKAAYARQDYTTALKECRAAAKEGDADAQTSLGLMYDVGTGVDQNHAEALK